MKRITFISLASACVGLLFLFQNCGKGFKSAMQTNSDGSLSLTSSSGGSPGTGAPVGVGGGTPAAPPPPYVLLNQWAALPSITPPAARQEHSAIWTGSKMIIWGGFNLSFLGNGSSYDPVAGTWVALPVQGAPSARASHSAVWTGSKMIVWGGCTNQVKTAFVGNGSAYDPIANTWTPISSTGAPTARCAHSAVWTGSKMIVWGGYNGAQLSDGGIYDPATDTWAPLAATTAVTARGGHVAVWTGSSMLVWGGYGAAGYLNTGAAFNPATGVWTALGQTGAPTARTQASAVWTGSKMVVTNGFKVIPGTFSYTPNPGYLADGAAYDPATQTWSPISATAAPSARQASTAVWTGNSMIVMGGFGGAFLADVKLYH
jgi:N-acetylneuraminic acid mutarotase